MPSTVLETHYETDLSQPSPAAGFARNVDELPVEGGTHPVVGNVTWKTLICADRTPSSGMLLGIAEFPAHGVLNPHRHEPAEFYFCTIGYGVVTVEGVEHPIRPGTAIYVPGNAEHGVKAGPDGMTFVYGFSENAFSDVAYAFSSQDNVVDLSAHRQESEIT